MALLPETRGIPVAVQEVVPVAVPVALLAAFVQVIDATDRLSDAVPLRRIGVWFVMYVDAAVGVVIATAGGMVLTTTVIARIRVFPAVSVARTWMSLLPCGSKMEDTLQGLKGGPEMAVQVPPFTR
jgi:hypothetical protein